MPFIFLIPDAFINTHLAFDSIYHCQMLCFQAMPVWSMKCRYSKLAKIRRTITEVCTDRQEVIITQWQPYFNLRIQFQSKALAIGYKLCLFTTNRAKCKQFLSSNYRIISQNLSSSSWVIEQKFNKVGHYKKGSYMIIGYKRSSTKKILKIHYAQNFRR